MIDLLNAMATKDASDLYLVPGVAVQINTDGVTHPEANSMMTAESIRSLIYGVMTDKQQKILESELECNFALSVPNLGRFRITVYYQRGQIDVVARYLKSIIPVVEDLSLPVKLKELVMEPRGLFLVVGSTGSGKSTTLAAMIRYNTRLTDVAARVAYHIRLMAVGESVTVTSRVCFSPEKSSGSASTE